MTALTLTLPVGFANGVGNPMAATHLSTPLSEVETWLQGQLGRDGVSFDNFADDEKVRGLNFMRNGLTEVFHRAEFGPWATCPDAYGTGAGMNPSPMPGSALRFYLRANAVALGMVFTARRVAVGAVGDDFIISSILDVTTLATQLLNSVLVVGLGGQIRVVSGTSTAGLIQKGWHTVQHTVTGSGAAFGELVSADHDLMIVAAYK